MALTDIIKSGVDTAFAIIDDLLTTVNYYSYESSVKDATTGESSTRYTSQAGVKVLIEDYSRLEIDGENIQSIDKKVSIPSSNLGQVPRPKDKIAEDTGQEWRVVEYDPSTDPTGAMYVLQCRRIL